eukprot:1065261-Rhodomonas_salina.1
MRLEDLRRQTRSCRGLYQLLQKQISEGRIALVDTWVEGGLMSGCDGMECDAVSVFGCDVEEDPFAMYVDDCEKQKCLVNSVEL